MADFVSPRDSLCRGPSDLLNHGGIAHTAETYRTTNWGRCCWICPSGWNVSFDPVRQQLQSSCEAIESETLDSLPTRLSQQWPRCSQIAGCVILQPSSMVSAKQEPLASCISSSMHAVKAKRIWCENCWTILIVYRAGLLGNKRKVLHSISNWQDGHKSQKRNCCK